MVKVLRRMWGGARAAPLGPSGLWSDLLLIAGVAGLAYGAFQVAAQWHGVRRSAVTIDLSPWMLPWYTFQSLVRGLLAYALSLGFSLAYGYWAAKDARAARVLVPLLDILQSIPVLGFMPGLVIALVALFPRSNTGLELAAVLMIFTGQAWNMTFSFYRSVQTVPREQLEAATVFGFNWWHRLRAVELPFATLGLVWNSMMSMAGGWFFLTLSEAFQLGDQDYRLPGLGSYMSVAAETGDVGAQVAAVVAMMAMVVALDQLLWRPLVAWAQKFRIEEGGGSQATSSWFLDWLRRSRLRAPLGRGARRCRGWAGDGMARTAPLAGAVARLRAAFHARLGAARGAIVRTRAGAWLGRHLATDRAAPVEPGWMRRTLRGALDGPGGLLGLLPLVALLALLTWGAFALAALIARLPPARWADIAVASGLTLGRVVVATAVGTLWTVPVGLAIGLSPRLARIFQPIIQIAASFPASMLFPAVIALLAAAGVGLGWGSVLLMLLGTQWYILFNVIAGAMTIPADLREAARAYNIPRRQRFRELYLPAIFPYLVTGWVTAMGGAWNASIVAEYVTVKHQTVATTGLGALISRAAGGDLPLLAASVLVMAVIVVGINRFAWRRLYRLAETRFSLEK